MDCISMRPSSWNGVGAMAKVPAAVWVSFMVCYLAKLKCFVIPGCALLAADPESRSEHCSGFGVRSLSDNIDAVNFVAERAPRNDDNIETALEPPRRFLDLIFREENLPGMIDDILSLPSAMRRFPAVHFHHPHLAHAARAGDAEHFPGLIAGKV